MKLPTLLLMLCAMTAASAQPQGEKPRPPRERGGPPPEAFEVCKGKKDGDTVQVKNGQGEVIAGTCRMVMIPTRPPGDASAPPRERPRQ